MVLICNDPRFIFLKTQKTAGTSVEKLFQGFCLPDGHDGVVRRKPAISERGVVGARGDIARFAATPDWYNHMPAAAVEDRVGRDFFARAFKFATVRNPYRTALSRFFFARRLAYPSTRAQFLFWRWRFRRWLNGQPRLEQLGDQEMVHVRGAYILDDFVRQEHLAEDIARVAGKLDLAVETQTLSHDKRNTSRGERFPPSAYYDDRSARIVQNAFHWCFEHCGYSLDVSEA